MADKLSVPRRPQRALPEQGTGADRVAQRSDLRPRAGDERAGGGRCPSEPQLPVHRGQLRQRRHAGAHRGARGRHRGRGAARPPGRPGARGGGDEGCSVVVTADHGSCGEMVDPVTGEPRTRHTVYPGPRQVIDETAQRLSVGTGIDSIAPIVLSLSGLLRLSAMEGPSVLVASAKAGDGAG